MSNIASKPTVGGLKISQDVVASIARVAALEIEGVDSFAEPSHNIRGFFARPIIKKSISITMNDDFVDLTLSLNLKYGAKISEVCTAVQNNVKDNIQTMTGLAVSKINVMVAGIVIPRDKEE